jgi:hypothetical protein
MRISFLLLAGSMAVASVMSAQSVPNACGLLAKADVDRLIVRGRPTYNVQPEAVVTGRGKGSVCLYVGGDVGIYVGPNSSAAAEGHLKMLEIDKVARQPVSGIGDKAFLLFPPPIKRDSDHEGPFLVMTVGEYTVTAFLYAWKGQADGPVGTYCRDSLKLKKSEKEGCRKTLADVSEDPKSLRPQVEELGKLLAAKVRTGKF